VPAEQVGNDSDFGASPVVFNKYVGACDKDGIFYLLKPGLHDAALATPHRRRVL
jgi:hypothetical protein